MTQAENMDLPPSFPPRERLRILAITFMVHTAERSANIAGCGSSTAIGRLIPAACAKRAWGSRAAYGSLEKSAALAWVLCVMHSVRWLESSAFRSTSTKEESDG